MESKLRKMACKLNPLSRSDGSAMYGQGATIVIAAMLGPVEVKSQNLSIEDSYIESHFRPKAGQPTTKDRIRESIIRDICELALLTDLHPRTKMSIQLQELEDRGGLEACSINAACMALLIGGLPLKFSFAAVHSIINKEGELLLDPDVCQMRDCRASFTIVYDSVEGNVLSVQTKGAFKIAEFNDAECLSRAASKEIFDFYKVCLQKFHSNALQPPTTKTDTNADEDADEPMVS